MRTGGIMGCCDLRQSNVHGKGIFATEKLQENKVLFETHTKTSGAIEWINLMPNHLYNHSTNPNCRSMTLGNFKYLVTLRDIEVGEELLVDYTKDTDLEQPKSDWL